MLRQFLYLDERLLRELLAQAEGGVYGDRKERKQATKSGKGTGGLKVPFLEVGAEAGGTQDESSDVQVAQTPAYEFDRLHEFLEKKQMLVPIPPIGDKEWAGLARGQFVEIEAELALSGMSTIGKLADAATGFVALMEATGQEVDPETKANMGLIQLFASGAATAHMPTVVRVAGFPKYKFRARLDRRFVSADDDQLAGESIVIGKIQRKIEMGQSLALDEIFPGAEFIGSQERRKLEKSLQAVKLGGQSVGPMSLAWPAADLTPLAVFR